MLCAFIALIFIAGIAYEYYRNIHLYKVCQPTFRGKTVLITGGSSGLGEQMAKRFVDLGAKSVIIASRTIKELERVKSETSDPSKVQVL